MNRPKVKIHVLPGGRLPERQTEGAIGFDVALRAIVCAHEMDAHEPRLRRTLFDFKHEPENPEMRECVFRKNGALAYRLEPGQQVLGGIGFATEMNFPLFFWVAPRSGLASKKHIMVTNAPGTVDPDYRGEAGVVILNRGHRSFTLEHNMRIAQIIFQEAIIPDFVEIAEYQALAISKRGAGGFGSTGGFG